MKTDAEKRDACFLCSSPYQVIGAVSIASGTEPDADLYLFGSFPGHEELAKRLRAHALFRSVTDVEMRQFGSNGKWTGFRKIAFAEKLVARFLPDGVSYRCCYVSSRSSMKSATLKVLRDREPDMLRVMFEDGMGSYSDNGNLLGTTRLRALAEKLFGWDVDAPEKTQFTVFLPELLRLPERFAGCQVTPMPRLALTGENRALLEDLFGVEETQRIAERFVVFDISRRANTRLSETELGVLDCCYDLILRYAGRENAIVKPHPKSTGRTASELTLYPYQGLPMEVLYIGMPDLAERVLISFVSSAVFTPKILFDAEPTVICLHRLLKETVYAATFEGIYDRFRGTYREPERVCAPESFEELEELLRRLCPSSAEGGTGGGT